MVQTQVWSSLFCHLYFNSLLLPSCPQEEGRVEEQEVALAVQLEQQEVEEQEWDQQMDHGAQHAEDAHMAVEQV